MLFPNSFEAGYNFLSDTLQLKSCLRLSAGIWNSLWISSILLVKQMLTFLNCQIASFSLDITASLHSETPVLLALLSCLSFRKLVPFTLLFLHPLAPGGSLCLFGDDSESLLYLSTPFSPQPNTYHCLGTFCIRNSRTAKLANAILTSLPYSSLNQTSTSFLLFWQAYVYLFGFLGSQP